MGEHKRKRYTVLDRDGEELAYNVPLAEALNVAERFESTGGKAIVLEPLELRGGLVKPMRRDRK